MATVSLEGVVQNNAESTNGWNTGNLDGELSYQGSGSIGLKVGSGTTGIVHTGTARNFSVGGASEGDHIIVILNSLTAGKLDSKANGGLRVRFGTSASAYGDKYVDGSDTKPPTTAFLPYIVNPAADFDAVAGGLSLTGNPAQLGSAATFGGVFKATSGIMGNFNNSLVDQITIGKGLRISGTGGTLQDFVATDESTVGNRWGFVTTKDGVVYTQGSLFFDGEFNDADQVLIFQDAPVAADFYNMEVNAGSSVTIDGFVIKSAGVSQVALVHSGGDLSISNSSMDAFRSLTLQANAIFQNVKVSNSGSIASNGALIENSTILQSTAASALVINSVAELSNINGVNFIGNSGHSIEITAPGTYNFNNLNFTGGGASESTSADVYNNSGGLVQISPSGGNEPTVRNGAGSTTEVVSAPVTLTFDGIPNGLETRIRRGSLTLENGYQSSVVGNQFVFSYQSTIAGKKVTVSIGGVADDGKGYERQEIPITLPASNALIPVGLNLNISYIG